MAYDIILRNGLIVDGTGAKAYNGDVGIKDGRIVEVGTVTGDGERIIDAGGRVIAPGFIDAHTHYDAQLLWDPSANPSTTHGITTVFIGNCGYTLAPVRPEDQDYLMGLFSAAEEIPKEALQLFAPFAWETFPEYLNSIEGRVGVNVLALIGHSAVRRFVMGEDAIQRSATEDEILQMVKIVEAALDAGAAGLSTSQAPHQRGESGEHIPSFFATMDETRSLAQAVRRRGKRLLCINPASKRDGLNDEDRKLLAELAELSGAVVSWNDFGLGTPNGDSVVDFMEAELELGHEIYAVARCQRAETRFTLKKLSAIFANSEPWVELSRLDPPEKLAALADPQWRGQLGQFWETAPYMVNASVEKAHSPETLPLEGRMLVDIADERGVTPAEVMFDVAIEDELQTFFRLSGPVDVDETRLERILKSPSTVVGISDGGAHLQTFAGGDYTSYFLAHWVREKGAFTLEEGVAALTSRVAGFLGLTDRGTLAIGNAADIVIFDPVTVQPEALQTLDDIPGGGTRMTKGSRGIPWVLVNGEPVVEDGAATDTMAGSVLGR